MLKSIYFLDANWFFALQADGDSAKRFVNWLIKFLGELYPTILEIFNIFKFVFINKNDAWFIFCSLKKSMIVCFKYFLNSRQIYPWLYGNFAVNSSTEYKKFSGFFNSSTKSFNHVGQDGGIFVSWCAVSKSMDTEKCMVFIDCAKFAERKLGKFNTSSMYRKVEAETENVMGALGSNNSSYSVGEMILHHYRNRNLPWHYRHLRRVR